jgi:DNA-binding GntR family transcriptional regulator
MGEITPEPGYTYVQVADQIEAEIRAGRLPVGAMLPGERALAEEHGIALGTARRALRELRDRGLIVTLPSKGTYVRRMPGEPSQT